MGENAEYHIVRRKEEAVAQTCFVKKGVLRNFAKFTGKHLCQSLFFNKVAGLKSCNYTKKDTLAQVFSGDFCEISKNVIFYRTLLVTAPGKENQVIKNEEFLAVATLLNFDLIFYVSN